MRSEYKREDLGVGVRGKYFEDLASDLAKLPDSLLPSFSEIKKRQLGRNVTTIGLYEPVKQIFGVVNKFLSNTSGNDILTDPDNETKNAWRNSKVRLIQFDFYRNRLGEVENAQMDPCHKHAGMTGTRTAGLTKREDIFQLF